MKLSKTLFTLSITALLFTSCEKQEDALLNNETNVETTQAVPALPSTINTGNKGTNNFWSNLQSTEELKGSWKLQYQLIDGKWASASKYGVDLSFFAGTYYYGNQILVFNDQEVELFREKMVFANGNEYPRSSAGTFPFAKTSTGLSIGTENPDSVNELFWNYRAYTCWGGKGIMIIPVLDENDENSLSKKATPHFFIKE